MRLIPVLDTEDWRSFEKQVFAEKQSFTFMEQAAQKLWEQLSSVLESGELTNASMPCVRSFKYNAQKPILVLVGPGNNGGDAILLASILHVKNIPYQLVLLVAPDDLTGDARLAWQKYVAINAPYKTIIGEDQLKNHLESGFALIIDGILGTGQKLPLEPWFEVVERCVVQNAAPIFAVDLPKENLSATWTVFLGGPRTEVYARQNYGQWVWADLGYDPEIWAQFAKKELYSPQWEAILPPLNPWLHKYQQGVVGIMAGSELMPGAAHLCCDAALRTGASVVNLCIDEFWPHSYSAQIPEVVLRLRKTDGEWRKKVQAWCVGPGLADNNATRKAFAALWEKREAPMVVDATALDFLSPYLGSIKSDSSPVILTPHEGEWQRLWGEVASTNFKARVEQVCQAAQQWKLFIVLKGPTTLIACPQGRVAVWSSPQGAMAKAGMGDILSGIITSFCSQGMDAWWAAILGVAVHSRSAYLAQKTWNQRSLQAREVVAFLPKIIEECSL